MDPPADAQGVPEGAEVARSLTWPKVATDYHGALLRLATMRAAKKHYLIFGYVELFPRDLPLPESFPLRQALGGAGFWRRCNLGSIRGGDAGC
jgi:hypothetical protein